MPGHASALRRRSHPSFLRAPVTVAGVSAVPTWEEVARDYGATIYNMAYRFTGNPDDASDLVQEVLLRVRRGLASYRPGSFEGWLYRITSNCFLDSVRRRRRRRAEPLPDQPDRVAALPTSPAPDEVLAAIRLGDDVQAALLSLPAEFRLAVILCDLEGLPYHEIAETLGIPIGTVRSRIHRGRLLLRRALEGERD